MVSASKGYRNLHLNLHLPCHAVTFTCPWTTKSLLLTHIPFMLTVYNQGGRTSISLPTRRNTNPAVCFFQYPWRVQYIRMRKRKENAQLLQKPYFILSRNKQMFSSRLIKPNKSASGTRGRKEEPREEICPVRSLSQHHPHLLLKASPLWEKPQLPPPPSSKSQEAILISVPFFC